LDVALLDVVERAPADPCHVLRQIPSIGGQGVGRTPPLDGEPREELLGGEGQLDARQSAPSRCHASRMPITVFASVIVPVVTRAKASARGSSKTVIAVSSGPWTSDPTFRRPLARYTC